MTIILDALSPELTAALRSKAQQQGRRIEDVAVDALARGLAMNERQCEPADGNPKRIDLTGIAGTMSEEDARAIEETVKWMDQGDLATRS